MREMQDDFSHKRFLLVVSAAPGRCKPPGSCEMSLIAMSLAAVAPSLFCELTAGVAPGRGRPGQRQVLAICNYIC